MMLVLTVCSFEGTQPLIKYSSIAQSVEHSAVNRECRWFKPNSGSLKILQKCKIFFITLIIGSGVRKLKKFDLSNYLKSIQKLKKYQKSTCQTVQFI